MGLKERELIIISFNNYWVGQTLLAVLFDISLSLSLSLSPVNNNKSNERDICNGFEQTTPTSSPKGKNSKQTPQNQHLLHLSLSLL